MKKRKLIVLIGVSGAGKTTIARRMVEEDGYRYIDFMVLMRELGESGKSYPDVLGRIAEMVNANDEADFVLDGYHVHRETSLKRLGKMLEHHRVLPIIVFADPEKIADRKAKRLGREYAPESVGNIVKRYMEEFIGACDPDWTTFIDTTDGVRWSSREEMDTVMGKPRSGQ